MVFSYCGRCGDVLHDDMRRVRRLSRSGRHHPSGSCSPPPPPHLDAKIPDRPISFPQAVASRVTNLYRISLANSDLVNSLLLAAALGCDAGDVHAGEAMIMYGVVEGSQPSQIPALLLLFYCSSPGSVGWVRLLVATVKSVC
jgi:hypothetical protein